MVVISRISMDVELRHQSDEYFTVESTAADLANRSSRTLAK